MNILQTESLVKEYRKGKNINRVLNGINVSVKEGEFLAIMGSSGSGKTTLLQILSGIQCPTSGRVLINGIDLFSLSEDERTEFRRSNIGFIYQNYNLLSFLNGYDNITLPAKLDGNIINDQRLKEITRYLEIDVLLDQKAETMSGGQQQRVAIARAVYIKPKILFADELTGNLDSNNRILVMDLLKKLQLKFRQTILMVTHDSEVAKVADKIIYMKDGNVFDAK